MRGKRKALIVDDEARRITPADAGKTRCFLPHACVFQDHPRGCGENINWDCCQTNGAGSPPRMRGKRLPSNAQTAMRGITPADAGKTIWFRSQSACRWDHPRGCGENRTDPKSAEERLGSPPRMRGKLLVEYYIPVVHRITPADAGKTDWCS